jgi:hypothetical protein
VVKPNLLEGYKTPLNWRQIGAGFLFGILIAAIIAVRICVAVWPRPGSADTPHVAVTPPGQEPVVGTHIPVIIHGQGEGSGMLVQAPGPPASTSASPSGGEHTPEGGQAPFGANVGPSGSFTSGEGGNPSGGTPGNTPQAQPAQVAFNVGDQAAGAFSGQITVNVTEKDSGKSLSSSPLDLSGSFLETFPGPGQVKLTLDFESPGVITVTVPPDKDPWLRIGARYFRDGLELYGQASHQIAELGPMGLEVYGGASVPIGAGGVDWGGAQIGAGVELTFK